MSNKVFTKQLTALVLGTAVVFLSACSEVIELPEPVTTQTVTAETPEAPEVKEQETSLAAPIIIDTSATEVEEETPIPSPASTNAPTAPQGETTETEIATEVPREVTPEVPAPTTLTTEPEPTPEPVVTEPEATPEPLATEPVVTEPVVTEPVVTEPAQPVSDQSGVWQPTPGTTWQWQLEPWRTDANDFPQAVIGKKMSSWDEYWLDISNIDALKGIMTKRLDLAAEKNCDGVEPDNVDAYQNDSGFALTSQDQIAYNKFLAEEAHKRGLSVGLKNSVELVAELEPYFDWALNESCFQWTITKQFLVSNTMHQPVNFVT